MKKFITILSIIVLIMLCFSNYVLADSITDSMKDQWNNENQDTQIMKKMGGKILNIIQIIGAAVAVIMLSVLGIKYMMAAPSERADFKKSAGIYVFGAILVFAATNIIGIIANFASNNIS